MKHANTAMPGLSKSVADAYQHFGDLWQLFRMPYSDNYPQYHLCNIFDIFSWFFIISYLLLKSHKNLFLHFFGCITQAKEHTTDKEANHRRWKYIFSLVGCTLIRKLWIIMISSAKIMNLQQQNSVWQNSFDMRWIRSIYSMYCRKKWKTWYKCIG